MTHCVASAVEMLPGSPTVGGMPFFDDRRGPTR